MTSPQKPSAGRIVNYVLKRDYSGGNNEGEIRPMVVVRVVAEETVNGQVFLDDSVDAGHVSCVTEVPYDDEPIPGTWHWPPRV